jgi:hypothetical protein
VEYRAGGNTGVEGWITSSRDAWRTDAAIRIADAATRTSPLAWRGSIAGRLRSAADRAGLLRASRPSPKLVVGGAECEFRDEIAGHRRM